MKSGFFKLITLLPEYSQACIHRMAIIKKPSVLLNLFQGGVKAQGCAVGPVRGHGFHYIGHGKDAGLDENFLPFEPRG